MSDENNNINKITTSNTLINAGNSLISPANSINYKSTETQKSPFGSHKKRNKFFIHTPGHPPYNPYLIKSCKKSILCYKKEIPNYGEIIKRINTEYGIEEEKQDKKNMYMGYLDRKDPIDKYYNFRNNSSINNNCSKSTVENMK